MEENGVVIEVEGVVGIASAQCVILRSDPRHAICKTEGN